MTNDDHRDPDESQRAFRRSRVWALRLSALGVVWSWVFSGAILGSSASILGGGLPYIGGMILGIIWAVRLSRPLPEVGLVPFGSAAMTILVWKLALAPETSRPILDLFALGVACGLFTTPLRLVSLRHHPWRLRIVGMAVFACAFLAGPQTPVWALFWASAAATALSFARAPAFFCRLAIASLGRVLYRIRVTGVENVPKRGPAVLVCNHVSFVDWLLIWASIPRPARFIMDYDYSKGFLMRFILRQGGVILIAPLRERPDIFRAAFASAAEGLKHGDLVCIFPEGRITRTGKLQRFRAGVEWIVRETPVPVIPMGLVGVWGSFFSRQQESVWRRRPLRPWARIELRIGAPIPAKDATAEVLQARVSALIS